MTDPIEALTALFETVYPLDEMKDEERREIAEAVPRCLRSFGLTIAPIAPADEKVREAVLSLENLARNEGQEFDYAPDIEAINAALAERDALRTASQWQPIETAPRDGQKILLAKYGHWNDTGDEPVGTEEWSLRVWDNTRRVYGLWWCVAGHWSKQFNNWNDGVEPSGLAGATHWMPLPACPNK